MTHVLLAILSCGFLACALVLLLCVRQVGILRARLPGRPTPVATGLAVGDPLPRLRMPLSGTAGEVDLAHAEGAVALIFTSLSCPSCRAMLERLREHVIAGRPARAALYLVLVDALGGPELSARFLGLLPVLDGIDVHQDFRISNLPVAIVAEGGVVRENAFLGDEASIARLFHTTALGVPA